MFCYLPRRPASAVRRPVLIWRCVVFACTAHSFPCKSSRIDRTVATARNNGSSHINIINQSSMICSSYRKTGAAGEKLKSCSIEMPHAVQPQSAGGEVASPWLRCDHQPEALAQHTNATLTRTESNRTRQLEGVADYLATAAARQLLAASVLRGCTEPAFRQSLSGLETA